MAASHPGSPEPLWYRIVRRLNGDAVKATSSALLLLPAIVEVQALVSSSTEVPDINRACVISIIISRGWLGLPEAYMSSLPLGAFMGEYFQLKKKY